MRIKNHISLISSSFFVGITFKTIEKDFIGNWYCADMDKSTIEVYKAKDGFWYTKIIQSEKATNVGKVVLNKTIFNS